MERSTVSGKRLIFHIGAHKTATSFIQTVILGKCDPSRDFVVTPAMTRRSEFLKNYRQYVREESNQEAAETLVRSFISEMLADAPAAPRSIIVSEEVLLGQPFARRSFYPGRDGCARFLDGFRDLGAQVEVVLGVRDQVDFMESWYLQEVKAGTTADDIGKFLASNIHDHLDWGGLVDAFTQRGYRIRLYPYELIHTDFHAFCELLVKALDLELDAASFENEVRNTSISEDGRLLMQAIQRLPSVSNKQPVKNFIARHYRVRRGDRRSVLIPPVFRDAVRAFYRESNRTIAMEHFPSHSEAFLGDR